MEIIKKKRKIQPSPSLLIFIYFFVNIFFFEFLSRSGVAATTNESLISFFLLLHIEYFSYFLFFKKKNSPFYSSSFFLKHFTASIKTYKKKIYSNLKWFQLFSMIEFIRMVFNIPLLWYSYGYVRILYVVVFLLFSFFGKSNFLSFLLLYFFLFYFIIFRMILRVLYIFFMNFILCVCGILSAV